MHGLPILSFRARPAIFAAALLLPLAMPAVATAHVLISEIRIDHPGAAAGLRDREEFVELVGAPGTSLDALSYVVVGDHLPEGGHSGVIEKVIHLHDQVIGPSGRFVFAAHDFTPDNEDYTLGIDTAEKMVAKLRERNSALVNLQLKPSDALEFDLSGLYIRENFDNYNQSMYNFLSLRADEVDQLLLALALLGAADLLDGGRDDLAGLIVVDVDPELRLGFLIVAVEVDDAGIGLHFLERRFLGRHRCGSRSCLRRR